MDEKFSFTSDIKSALYAFMIEARELGKGQEREKSRIHQIEQNSILEVFLMSVHDGSDRKRGGKVMNLRKVAKPPKGRASQADNRPVENALGRIRVAQPNMAKSAQRIAQFILERPEEIVGMSVTELSEATGVSEGSVINFCRSIGLSGFQQMKLSLAQEIVQPVQFIHEDLERDDDMDTICRKVFHSGIQALRDTLSVLDSDAVGRAVAAVRGAKRVEIYGIGSSAPIAEDAQYRMLRIGLDVRAVTDSHIQAISASRCDPDVATITISHSGATHETVAATRLARETGAKTIVITNFARSPIQAFADIVLFTMARETRFRTEAMTSRIAQICVVDALIAGLALADYDHATDVLKKTFDVLSIKRF